jgi:hypothetical protein
MYWVRYHDVPKDHGDVIYHERGNQRHIRIILSARKSIKGSAEPHITNASLHAALDKPNAQDQRRESVQRKDEHSCSRPLNLDVR